MTVKGEVLIATTHSIVSPSPDKPQLEILMSSKLILTGGHLEEHSEAGDQVILLIENMHREGTRRSEAVSRPKHRPNEF